MSTHKHRFLNALEWGYGSENGHRIIGFWIKGAPHCYRHMKYKRETDGSYLKWPGTYDNDHIHEWIAAPKTVVDILKCVVFPENM